MVAALGPLLWLAKSAITPTQDTLRHPMALWPNGTDWANLKTAWVDVQLDRYFLNTLIIAAGSWACQMVVATTGGYVLSVLRPRYARCWTRRCWSRCSCRPSSCWCRCT